MPQFLMVRPMLESKKISLEEQSKCQSGVIMLLYLVKHSIPKIANMTRELSKANNGTNPDTFKELGLKIKPKENSSKPRDIVCFRNSDYAGDPVSRRRLVDSY